MRAQQIIRLAKDVRQNWGGNPYEIAEKCGIAVIEREACPGEFKAHTLKLEGYPVIIAINDAYTEHSKKILCAHELGHALLHAEGINHFSVSQKNIVTSLEYEADLFALALLMDESELAMPLGKMDRAMIRYIMNYNIQRK